MKFIAPIVVFGLIGIITSAFRGELFAGTPLFMVLMLFMVKQMDWRLWLLYILTASIFFSFLNDFPLSAAFALFFAVSLLAIFISEHLRPAFSREMLVGFVGILVWWAGIFSWQTMKGHNVYAGNFLGDIFWAFVFFLLILLLLQVWRKIIPAHRQ